MRTSPSTREKTKKRDMAIGGKNESFVRPLTLNAFGGMISLNGGFVTNIPYSDRNANGYFSKPSLI